MSLTPDRHVLIDARPINHPTARQRGIGRYTAGLIHGLALAGAEVVAASANEVESDIVRESVPGVDVRVWKPDLVRSAGRSRSWYVATQLMLHPLTLDPVPRAVSQARLPAAAVMYDVIPERYPTRYLVQPGARRLSVVRSMLARTLDGVLAISSFAASTAQEMLDLDSRRVVSIGAGVGEIFTPSSLDPWPDLTRLVTMGLNRRKGIVAVVTGGDERKNTEGLLRAWALIPESLRSTHQVVVACAVGREVVGRWNRLAEECGLVVGRDVIYTDSVNDDELVALHRAARLAVFPSLEEGFGLPVAEAAACDCPVICSNTSSLPEVIDCAEALFDPFDVQAMAHAVHWALVDDAHRARLGEAGRIARDTWTWKRTGERALAALDGFESLVEPTRRRAVARQIAVVAPDPQSRSAIGPYTELVVDSWRTVESGAVEVFVDESATDLRPEPGRFLVGALGTYRPEHDFDHVVAVLGSSGHHLQSALLAERHATHLWLHEASLAGCYLYAAVMSGSGQWAHRFVTERSERGADFFTLEPEEFHREGITMLGPVLARARSVVVSSRRAAEVVRGVRPGGPPVLVLPLAHRPAEAVTSVPLRRIVSAGWVAANKRPEVLVHVAERAEIDVVFVGPVVDAVAEQILDLASRLGVAHRVRVLGRLDEVSFDETLRSSRVGVQLRTEAMGQRSAAVGDLLARGIPVVTNLVEPGDSNASVRHVDIEDLDDLSAADAVIRSIGRLLDDDSEWEIASRRAHEIATSWTFADVAKVIDRWLDVAESLPAGSIHTAEEFRR